MIVDTRFKIGIREENIQVDLGKQLYGTRLPLAMSPTYPQMSEAKFGEDLWLL